MTILAALRRAGQVCFRLKGEVYLSSRSSLLYCLKECPPTMYLTKLFNQYTSTCSEIKL